MPFLLKHLTTTTAEWAFYIGLMTSVAAIAMIIANFAGGFLADEFGKKAVIVLGSALLTPSLLIYAFAPSPFWVMIVYFIQMFSISIFQPAFTAYVADLSRGSSRGTIFGVFNAFLIGSAIPGPFIGGLLVDLLGLGFPFVIADLISVVGLIACFSLTGISPRATQTEQTILQSDEEKCPMPLSQVLLLLGVLGLLSGLSTGLLVPLMRLYPIEVLNVNATELGLIFSIGSALVTTLVQLPGGGLADRFGRKPLMLISLLGAPFVLALAFTSSVPEFILMVGGMTALGNIAAPAYFAWQMELVPSSRRVVTAGLVNTLTGIGMFIGPFFGIWLYQSNIVLAFGVAALSWVVQIPPILKLKETKT
jgi:MFS family permease